MGLHSSVIPGTKIRKIGSLAASGTGAYVLRPFNGPSGFSGVLGLSKISDGSTVYNELFQERGVRVIVKSGTGSGNADCSALFATLSSATTLSSCTKGK